MIALNKLFDKKESFCGANDFPAPHLISFSLNPSNCVCTFKLLMQTFFSFQVREQLQKKALSKSWHCQKGEGSDPCQDFSGGFDNIKVITFPKKVIIQPQLGAFHK